MTFNQKYLVLLSFAALVACGGGGSSPTVTPIAAYEAYPVGIAVASPNFHRQQ